MLRTANDENKEEQALNLVCENQTEFSSQVISYIAGNVVRVLTNKILCQDCADALSSEPDSQQHAFILRKDNGGLSYPSKDVILVCKAAESVVRSYMDSGVKATKDVLVAKIMRDLVGRTNLFQHLYYHDLGKFPTSNHVTDLKKAIIEKYINIRIHFLLKQSMSTLSKRQLLNKYVLFSGK